MMTLTNLILNSKFINYHWDDSANVNIVDNWNGLSTTMKSNYSYLETNDTNIDYVGFKHIHISTNTYVGKVGGLQTCNILKTHKYYFRYKMLENNRWNSVSEIFSNATKTSSIAAGTKIGNLLLIDLTATFGKKNEPTIEWCDLHIPFFEGDYTIYKETTCKWTNKNDFVMGENDQYYYAKGSLYEKTETNFIRIKFELDNFDGQTNVLWGKEYAELIRKDPTILTPEEKARIKELQTKLMQLRIIHEDKSIGTMYFQGGNPSWRIKGLGNNKFECDVTIYTSTNVYGKDTTCNLTDIQLLGIDSVYREQFELMNLMHIQILKPTAYAELHKSEIYINGTQDDYAYTIEGKLLSNMRSPLKVQILINDNNKYGVVYDVNEDGLKTFSQTSFLHFGKNEIVVKCYDMFGNLIYEWVKNIEIQYEPESENYELFTNYINDDMNNIDIEMTQCVMKYNSNDVGNNTINLDNKYEKTHYFNLIGENSEYYQIDKVMKCDDKDMQIKSNILKKPIAITFDGVEKTYDGTQDAKKILLKQTYKFTDLQGFYNDYLNTGFVQTVSDKKQYRDVIYDELNQLQNRYSFAKSDVGKMIVFDSINLSIDDYCQDSINNNEIVMEHIKEYRDVLNSELDFGEISISKMNEILKTKGRCSTTEYDGLWWCVDSEPYSYKQDGEIKYCINATALEIKCDLISPIFNVKQVSKDIELENFDKERNELINALLCWLVAIDHKIYAIYIGTDLVIDYNDEYNEETHDFDKKVVVGEHTDFYLEFKYCYELFNEDPSYYEYTNEVIVQYDWVDNSDDVVYQIGDNDYVDIDFKNAKFVNKNVGNNKYIGLNGVKLIAGIKGNKSQNYALMNAIAYGSIKPRNVELHIECLDKIYDGTTICPYEFSKLYPNGLKNAIADDDVYCDDRYYGNIHSHESRYIPIEKTSNVFYNTPIVGNNKDVYSSNFKLMGKDSRNYNLTKVVIDKLGSIKPRQIELIVDSLIFNLNTFEYEITYHFTNLVNNETVLLTEQVWDVVGSAIFENGEWSNIIDKLNWNKYDTLDYLIFDNDGDKEIHIKYYDGEKYYVSKNENYRIHDGSRVRISGLEINNDNYQLLNNVVETTIKFM